MPSSPVLDIQKKAANGTGTAPTLTLTSTPTQGNLLVAIVYSAKATALTMTSTGWTRQGTATGGSGPSTRAMAIFSKIAGAAESTIVTAASGNGGWEIAVSEYGNVTNTVLNVIVAPGGGQVVLSSTLAILVGPANVGKRWLVVAALGTNQATAYSAQTLNDASQSQLCSNFVLDMEGGGNGVEMTMFHGVIQTGGLLPDGTERPTFIGGAFSAASATTAACCVLSAYFLLAADDTYSAGGTDFR